MKKNIPFLIAFLLISIGIQAQGNWQTMKISASQSEANDITAFQFDSQHHLWAATRLGVYQYQNGKWTLDGLEKQYIQSFFIDSQQRKWIGTWGKGVFCKAPESNEWSPISVKGNLATVYSIAESSDGDIWLGDWYSGITVLQKGNPIIRSKAHLLLGDSTITSIVFDKKGNSWISTYHGITCYNESTGSKKYDITNSILPSQDVYALLADSKGRIWIGTIKGLLCIANGKWTLYNQTNTPALSSDVIYCIAEDCKGAIWIGTPKGANFLYQNKWTHYDMDNSPLTGNRVQTISVEDDKVYLGTDNGITIKRIEMKKTK